jgi:hypothetical protein
MSYRKERPHYLETSFHEADMFDPGMLSNRGKTGEAPNAKGHRQALQFRSPLPKYKDGLPKFDAKSILQGMPIPDRRAINPGGRLVRHLVHVLTNATPSSSGGPARICRGHRALVGAHFMGSDWDDRS